MHQNVSMNSAASTEGLFAIYVDMGTTNTRVWLARGDEILARGSKTVGVRDAARDGSTTRIHLQVGKGAVERSKVR